PVRRRGAPASGGLLRPRPVFRRALRAGKGPPGVGGGADRGHGCGRGRRGRRRGVGLGRSRPLPAGERLRHRGDGPLSGAGLRVVLAHWGGGLPFYELMPEVAELARGVAYDSAASAYLYDWRVFRQVAAIVGAERVLFATDYPLSRPGRYVKQIRRLGFDE